MYPSHATGKLQLHAAHGENPKGKKSNCDCPKRTLFFWLKKIYLVFLQLHLRQDCCCLLSASDSLQFTSE